MHSRQIRSASRPVQYSGCFNVLTEKFKKIYEFHSNCPSIKAKSSAWSIFLFVFMPTTLGAMDDKGLPSGFLRLEQRAHRSLVLSSPFFPSLPFKFNPVEPLFLILLA